MPAEGDSGSFTGAIEVRAEENAGSNSSWLTARCWVDSMFVKAGSSTKVGLNGETDLTSVTIGYGAASDFQSGSVEVLHRNLG